VKDALIKAASHHSHQRDRDLALIFLHTRGVIFLGTPHRGTEKEALGDFVARAANLGLRKANTQLLRSLRTDSHILEKQRDDFVTISNKFLVRCVKEELPTAIGMVSYPVIYMRSLTEPHYRSFPNIPQITTASTSEKVPFAPIILAW
jgi:hypothetical protein